MKKFFTLLAAASIAVAANAGTRVLYAQDFETEPNPADIGWSYGGTSIGITGDDFGKFIQLQQGATNGRSGQCVWGDAIYGEEASFLEDGIYTVSFDFNPKQGPNNQYNCGLTLVSNLLPPGNQPFLGRWTYLKDADGANIEDMSKYQGYLFDLMQVQRETEVTTDIQFKVNGNDQDLIVLNGGDDGWYTFTFTVNVNDRTVEYSIDDLKGQNKASGVRTVPATECDGTPISMYATGLWIMVARYQTIFNFDNFKISCESTADVANTPSCALTGLGVDEEGVANLNLRSYTINFIEGETLHILGTDGVETEVDYYDCDGVYVYTTTTSGTLTCWTTCGSAKSEEVVMVVDATPCALPEATVDIVTVTNGYGKTYKVLVDNSQTPLAPTIFIDVKFVGNDGSVVEVKDAGTGATFTVDGAGDITITTKAFGYQSTTVCVKNDTEYSEKAVLDFARMTAEDIKGFGFTASEDLNSGTTSGEQNWTARKRLYYYDADTETVNEEGETVYTAVYPFGFVAEDDAEHVLHRWIISAEELTEVKAADVFPNMVIWNGLQAKMLEHIGLIQDATTNNYNAVQVTGCDATDIVIFNIINDYGSNSCHPIVNTVDEYYAQLAGENHAYPVSALGEIALDKKTFGAWRIPETKEDAAPATVDETAEATPKYTVAFNLYRIDTALTKVTVFQAGTSGIENVAVEKIADNAWYTIDGIKLDAPARRGIYIHNGKKVFVNK